MLWKKTVRNEITNCELQCDIILFSLLDFRQSFRSVHEKNTILYITRTKRLHAKSPKAYGNLSCGRTTNAYRTNAPQQVMWRQ